MSAWATSAAKPPHVSTGGAAHPNQTSVGLNGVVNPRGVETTCYFQYGATTAYGAQTAPIAAGTGTVGVKVSQPLTGLQPGTTYHYRLVATSASGTSEGRDHTFTTTQTPLRFVIAKTSTVQVFGRRLTLTGTLSGTDGANHQLTAQTSPFPFFAGFQDIATSTASDAEGSFSFTLPSFTQTTEVRVRTLDPLPIFSKTLTVHVAALVTLRAHSTATRGLVRLSGTVAPAESSATVLFQRVQQGRGPLTVATTTTKPIGTSSSRFSSVVNIRRSGSYRALVKVSNGRQVSGYSTTVTLRGAPRKAAHRHGRHSSSVARRADRPA
ncbi:MAG TPA: hypothetical protein VGI76_04550 [Solirubrobacteraceae bacterium]